MHIPDFPSLMLLDPMEFAGDREPPLTKVHELIAAGEGLSTRDIREVLWSGWQPVESFGSLGRGGMDLV